MSDDNNPIELVSEITHLNDITTFFEDKDVDRAMAVIIKMIAERGAVPQAKAPAMIVELSALSAKFGIQATYYMTLGKYEADASQKKNLMFTMRDSLGKLADSLKYIAR